ncbi:MAG: uracil-DNA glycosylase [Elusimicrobia bacterium]|nr:uracil-DNA glycosylase [Elusimicrobiota bacterium]
MGFQFDLFDGKQNDILGAGTYEEFKRLLEGSRCALCALHASRTHIVVDRGNPKSKILMIGEGPGENEDLQGRAFVGRSGRLMDRLVAEELGMDTNRDFLIANVIKCRPPQNRTPEMQEAQACLPFLRKQVELMRPQVILLLGATALKHLVPEKKNFSMEKEAGRFFSVSQYAGVQWMVLYHPAYLLYDPRKEPAFRQHLQSLKKLLEKVTERA